MKGTFQRVEYGVSMGKWDGSRVHLTNNYDGNPRDYFIFGNSPMNATIKGLNEGDQIELLFVQSGKFKNLDDIKLIGGSSGTNNNNSGASNSNSNDVQKPFVDKDATIRRAVCLKAAVELVAATATGKSKPADLAQQAVDISPIFDPYLKGEVTVQNIDDIIEEL